MSPINMRFYIAFSVLKFFSAKCPSFSGITLLWKRDYRL